MATASLAVARPKLKIALRWLVAGLGLLFGLAALSIFSTDFLPIGDRSDGWFLRWLGFAGSGLLAIGFLVGSLTAPRNPKWAGVIFLAFLPATAFCMAYPDAGVMVWDKVGNGWYETPLPLTAIGLALTFFAPFAALFLLLRSRKWGAIVSAALAIFAILVFAFSRWTSALLPRLASLSVPFLLFGVFWLETHRFHWPVLLEPGHTSLARRIVRTTIWCLVIVCAGFVISVCRELFFSSLFNGDCRAKPPFTEAHSEYGAVFTARIVYVGLSKSSRWELSHHPQPIDSRIGDWAIGVVQERFWGISPRWPRLVLLTNFVFWKGETYFVDGIREHSLLNKILPAVLGGIGCSRTQRIEDAIIDMRILHQAPPRRAAIVGYVREPGPYNSMMTPPQTQKFLGGAQIDVTEPGGSTTVNTDSTGIYELDGLPEGDYTVQLHAPEGQTALRFNREWSIRHVHLDRNELIEVSFDLQQIRADTTRPK